MLIHVQKLSSILIQKSYPFHIHFIVIKILILEKLMAEKFIEFLKGQIDAHTYVEEFFSKDVRLDVENEARQRTLTFEELPAFLDGLQHPRNSFALTGRRTCVDRENECDFEVTYEIGNKSKIFWASLTPAQNKIQRGVIREQKWLYGQ